MIFPSLSPSIKSSLYEYEMLETENPHTKNYKYEFQINDVNLDNILEYVNSKYKKKGL